MSPSIDITILPHPSRWPYAQPYVELSDSVGGGVTSLASTYIPGHARLLHDNASSWIQARFGPHWNRAVIIAPRDADADPWLHG